MSFLVYGSISELVDVEWRTSSDSKVVTLAVPSTLAGASLTLTTPNVASGTTDNLLGRLSTDQTTNRLQNKDLDDASVGFVNTSDTSKKLILSLGSIATSTTRTWTVPNANDTFLGLAATQSPTNKTFDSTSTLTGARMASFTPDGSHTLTAPASTDTLVARNTTDTLTNKSVTSLLALTDLQMRAAAPLKFYNAGNTQFVALQAGTLSGNVTWTLPTTDSTGQQALVSNGSATLSWASILANPMTTTGDIIYSSDNSGTPARRAVGTSSQVLVGGTTPTWGSVPAAALPNVTQSAAGAVASAGQLLGTNTNDTASAGNVGELKGPITRLRSAATALTSGNALNVTTTGKITLTAGDWRINPMLGVTAVGAVSITALSIAVSKTSNTLPGTDTIAVPTGGECWLTEQYSGGIAITGDDTTICIPFYQVTVANAATLDLYLVCQATFSGGTSLSVYGSLVATRIR